MIGSIKTTISIPNKMENYISIAINIRINVSVLVISQSSCHDPKTFVNLNLIESHLFIVITLV